MNRIITFGQSTVAWDAAAPPFEKTRQSALQYLRHIVDADTAAAERTASKQEEDARRSQQVQPKYSEPYPAKGRGKGKRRPKERATQPTARTDAAVPRTGEDAGTGTTPATAGLSSDNA